MDFIKGITNEFKKNKRTGLFTLVIVSIIIIIPFQGGLGLLAASIDESNIFITALSLYFRLFFPVFLGLFISISLHNEKKYEAILVYYYNAVPVTKVYRNKLCAQQIQGVMFYALCVIIAMLFILLEGGSPLTYIRENLYGVLYTIIGITLLINIQFLISIILNNQILSLLIALLGSIGNFFVASTSLWIYYPWSYPFRMLYHTSIHTEQIAMIVLMLLLSFWSLLFSRKRFERIMLAQ
ncbi:ABC transporter permease [Oceanobacillus senegalensis]|uniref:ABC transporter permease n=1 Tax=Oceanobacillus senegalensis TaxID=1936063 RepID=UPI000A30BFBB|nr:ABC transporter permease [Oceanobacillus senegalensis]